jgi:Amt family ammonium transporter
VVVFAIEFIDKKLKVDDPVAVSVHGVCGALGTLLVGFLQLTRFALRRRICSIRCSSNWCFAIAAWAIITSFIVLFILKKTMGLRVTKEEEIDGLDIHEHGTNVYN